MEKDFESISEDNRKWLKWSPIDEKNMKGKQKTEFLLGDFYVFGNFLKEITGDNNKIKDVANAE